MKKILSYLFVPLLFVLFTSCSYMIKDFKNAGNSYFTVIKNFEAVETEEFDLNLQETLFIKGDPSKYTTEEKGFTLDSSDYNKESNTLTLNFKRNEVTLTFHLCEGAYTYQTGEDIPKTGKFGAVFYPLDPNALTKTDYEFSGWSLSEGSDSINLPYTFPAEDCDYYALWKSVDNDRSAKYTVVTLLQNVDDDGYTELYRNTHMGVVGEETKVVASQREGFYPLQIEQQVISSDGNTIVNVKYDRKEMVYEFYLSHDEEEERLCHWTADPDDIEDRSFVVVGRYESSSVSKLPADPVHDEIDGEVWEFAGWNEVNGEPDETFRKDRTFYAVWKKTIAKYTVEHYFEAVNENDTPIKLVEYPDRVEKNTIGEYTNAQPYKTTPGFSVDRVENVLLEENGSVAKVFYRRANILITLDPNGGVWKDGSKTSKFVSGKYGQAVSVTDITDDLSQLKGWKKNGAENVLSLPSTFPESNETYIAMWEKVKSVYSVKFYYENIDDDAYVQNKMMTLTRIGPIGGNTEVDDIIRSKLEEGFVFESDSGNFDVAIPESDDTVIEVKFKRKVIHVVADVNGATWEDGTKEPKSFTGKYQSALNVPTSSWYLHSANHREVSFDGGLTWTTVERPTEFPANDAIYKIIWDDLGVPYQVKYYEQKVDGSGYELVNTENLSGAAGDTTTITPAAKVGFKTKEVEQKKINADGKTVIQVYYDRKSVSLTFGAGDFGKWKDNESAKTVTGLFGQTVVIPNENDLISDELYEFNGWMLATEGASDATVSVPSTFPDTDMIYKVKWSKIESTEVGGNEGNWIVDAGAKDIEIVKTSIDSTSYVLIVKVPFKGNWNIVWTVDGEESTVTSLTKEFEKGNHQISVIASCNGIEYTTDTTLTIN